MAVSDRPPGGAQAGRARREAVASVTMLAAFAVWTVAFILISGWVSGGDVHYLRGWWPWLGVTALWMLPLLGGIGLGAHAAARGGGRLAWAGLILNAAVLVLLVGPPLADRLVHL